MSVTTSNGTIAYRANRWRYTTGALLVIPFTVFMGALTYDFLVVGDQMVRDPWLLLLMLPIYLWLDYVLLAALIWPPEVDVSTRGIRWANAAMLQKSAFYGWDEIEGPEEAAGVRGVPLLRIVVKASRRKLEIPPSHFGSSYAEMAAAITEARKGRMLSIGQWRERHPPQLLRHWLINWGLPAVGGILLAAAIIWLGH